MVVTGNESTPQPEKSDSVGRYVGVDLHKNMFEVSFFNSISLIHKVKSYLIKEIASFINDLDTADIVAVESTNNKRYFVNSIREHVSEVKIVNPSRRRGEKRKLDPAEKIRYNERTAVERVFGRLKDEFDGRLIRVRGATKVMAHLMFGILALTADQLLKFVQ